MEKEVRRNWLKISEVATYLGLAVHHCYRMHQHGQLPSFNLPGVGVRVDRTDLDEMIKQAKEQHGTKVKAARAAYHLAMARED